MTVAIRKMGHRIAQPYFRLMGGQLREMAIYVLLFGVVILAGWYFRI